MKGVHSFPSLSYSFRLTLEMLELLTFMETRRRPGASTFRFSGSGFTTCHLSGSILKICAMCVVEIYVGELIVNSAETFRWNLAGVIFAVIKFRLSTRKYSGGALI